MHVMEDDYTDMHLQEIGVPIKNTVKRLEEK